MPCAQVLWTLNDSRITGQEYLRGARQYLVGEEGGAAGGGWRHWLTVPSVGRQHAGKLSAMAENASGRAVAHADLAIAGENVTVTCGNRRTVLELIEFFC